MCKDSRGFVSLSSVAGVARGLRTESVPLVNSSDTLDVVYEYEVRTSLKNDSPWRCLTVAH